jgi:IS5 family transposase
MKPKKSPHSDRQRDLSRVELCRIVDPSHGLIKLANVVEWDRLDELFGSTYCLNTGRPAVSKRLMVALYYLKYTFNAADRSAHLRSTTP